METPISSTDEVPHLDITIHEETLRLDVKKVIVLLRPDWSTEQLVIECKSDGYINKNYHCHVEDRKDGLFVRLINTKIKEDLLGGSISSMKYLSRRGMGAKLLCTFVNGLVMEFVHGEPITWQGFRRVKEERNWLGAARELARYHGTTNLDDIRELGVKSYKQRFSDFGEQLSATLEKGIIPKESLEGLPSVGELQELRQRIYTIMENMNAELCFCHSDPNPTNFILTDQGPVLVDYDMCTLEFAACNLAHFFSVVIDVADMKMEGNTTEEEKDIFIREYLEQRRLIDPSRGPVTEKQVWYWKYLIRRGELLTLLGGVGAIIFLQELDKKIDLNGSHLCWNVFQSYKHILDEQFLDEQKKTDVF